MADKNMQNQSGQFNKDKVSSNAPEKDLNKTGATKPLDDKTSRDSMTGRDANRSSDSSSFRK
ncbi:hypothetical protein [Bdellovibrio sp. NC01]|uniref:hypothetical protein n=1 Tax=Bdellovibrio sp. NC01 TaxID=2220073 RepID=UPI00115AE422|nr:hypothetical protein [Bdellovibrio sp. NC01]QDK37766.1 hypothetical protein DOE51_09310 [Bdellovibrio sp. NC01]